MQALVIPDRPHFLRVAEDGHEHAHKRMHGTGYLVLTLLVLSHHCRRL